MCHLVPVRSGVAQGSLAQGSPAQGCRHKVSSPRLFSHGCFHRRYIVFLLFVTVFFVFQCFKALLHRWGRNGTAGAQLCRAGWVMCQFDERGGVVAETWRALRVPHAPSVKPGAANCCHCLFAWSPSGTPTSPGPRRRSFNNDGSVAARQSVTRYAQKTTKPDISNLTTRNRSQKLVHQVGTRLGTRLAQG